VIDRDINELVKSKNQNQIKSFI